MLGTDARRTITVSNAANSRVTADLDRLIVQLDGLSVMLGRHGTHHRNRFLSLSLLCLGRLFLLTHHNDDSHYSKDHYGSDRNDHCHVGASLFTVNAVCNIIAGQKRHDLADADRIKQVLIQCRAGGIDTDDSAVLRGQRAAGISAAQGGIRLNQLTAGTALRQKAADTAGSDTGVTAAERGHCFHSQICRLGESHGMNSRAQHIFRRFLHHKGDPLIAWLSQTQHSHILFIVIIHQISLFLIILAIHDLQFSAAGRFAGQDEIFHHMAVRNDILGLFPLFAHKEARAAPVVHHPVLIWGTGINQNNTVQHSSVKRRHCRHCSQSHH